MDKNIMKVLTWGELKEFLKDVDDDFVIEVIEEHYENKMTWVTVLTETKTIEISQGI